MYDEHYGLTGRPFQLTPDPHFWFDTATHRKAMAYLGYGLAQGEGFIVITGDIGAGKTTLVGHLIGDDRSASGCNVDQDRLDRRSRPTTCCASSPTGWTSMPAGWPRRSCWPRSSAGCTRSRGPGGARC